MLECSAFEKKYLSFETSNLESENVFSKVAWFEFKGL